MASEAPVLPVFEEWAYHLGRCGHSGTGLSGAGSDGGGTHSGSFEFHPQLDDESFEAGLRGNVGTHPRARDVGTVRTDDDEVASLAFDHSGEHPPREALRAVQVHVHLELEPFRVHLVDE